MLTDPKAIESIVCIFVDRRPSFVLVITAFFSTNVFPATDQNFKCLTPAVTKCVSEFGRNNARNIRSSDAIVHAILTPSFHRQTATVYGVSTPMDNKNFPLVEKLNEQTPEEKVFFCIQRRKSNSPRLCLPDRTERVS